MLAAWPELPAFYGDEELATRWEIMLQLKEEVNRIWKHQGGRKLSVLPLQACRSHPDEELPIKTG